MKILVLTSKTQGARATDFNFCVEGELAWIAPPCDTDALRLPGSCGCGRSFAGLASHRAGTTALVAELPMTREEYISAIAASLAAQGWPPSWAAGIECDQSALIGEWDVGTILERDLNLLTPRELVS